MWWIYALLSAFFAALTAIFAKVGIKGVESDLATAIRAVIILILSWGIAIFSGSASGIHTLSKGNIFFLSLSGVATGLSWIFYFKALQSGQVSHVAVLDKMSVVIVILLSIIFLGESLTFKSVVGALLIISGSLVLVSSN